MMRDTSVYRHSPDDTAPVKETIDQFLRRGGKIQRCPDRSAAGASMYAPVIAIDGYELPVTMGSFEYVPNFVRDLDTYTTAQTDRLTAVHDGGTALVREDEQRAVRTTAAWRQQQYHRQSREGADFMEND